MPGRSWSLSGRHCLGRFLQEGALDRTWEEEAAALAAGGVWPGRGIPSVLSWEVPGDIWEHRHTQSLMWGVAAEGNGRPPSPS